MCLQLFVNSILDVWFFGNCLKSVKIFISIGILMGCFRLLVLDMCWRFRYLDIRMLRLLGLSDLSARLYNFVVFPIRRASVQR